jgi:hypothetical protein
MTKELRKEMDRLEFEIAPFTQKESLRDAADNVWSAIKELDSQANQTQIGGDHYKAKSIQPWDFIAANQLGYFEGNIVKYVSRWKDKGGINDLKKARHYLDKLIELEHNSSITQKPTISKEET